MGDLVLLQDDTMSRGSWPMCVVQELFPSQDGLVRSVKVRTRTSSYLRPISKLVLLESNCD